MPRPARSASGTRTSINTVTGRKVVSVHRSKVESFLDRTADAVLWDLVFLDPPYPLDEPALAAVLAKLMPHLREGAVVVVERSSRTPEPAWPQGMERFAEKKYGETRLWFAEPGVEAALQHDADPEAPHQKTADQQTAGQQTAD